MAGAVRRWAVANPHEYALVFGSPVPGYRAPEDTVDPATRTPFAFLTLVADAAEAGAIGAGRTAPIDKTTRADFAAVRASTGFAIVDPLMHRSLAVWMQLFGMVSFELFGHLHNVIHDYDAFFEGQVRAAWRDVVGAA